MKSRVFRHGGGAKRSARNERAANKTGGAVRAVREREMLDLGDGGPRLQKQDVPGGGVLRRLQRDPRSGAALRNLRARRRWLPRLCGKNGKPPPLDRRGFMPRLRGAGRAVTVFNAHAGRSSIMDEKTEQIKILIKKLLALSKSGNENEAAAALKKANELMRERGIGEETLRFESVRAKAVKTYQPWRVLLGNAVAWLYSCHICSNPNEGNYIFTGEPLYAFMAGEMFSYLAKTVGRIAKKEIRKNAKLKFRDSFKYGIAVRLCERIYETGGACSWAPRRDNAIAEAEQHVKKTTPLETRDTKQTAVNTTAFNRGRLRADGISLARQTGHSPPRIEAPRAHLKQGELFNDF
jgi:hypothetical protein